nr:hypothetical protein [Halomonas saliphila]
MSPALPGSWPDIYHPTRPKYEGRITVPVLWDKKARQIVSNDSARGPNVIGRLSLSAY